MPLLSDSPAASRASLASVRSWPAVRCCWEDRLPAGAGILCEDLWATAGSLQAKRHRTAGAGGLWDPNSGIAAAWHLLHARTRVRSVQPAHCGGSLQQTAPLQQVHPRVQGQAWLRRAALPAAGHHGLHTPPG